MMMMFKIKKCLKYKEKLGKQGGALRMFEGQALEGDSLSLGAKTKVSLCTGQVPPDPTFTRMFVFPLTWLSLPCLSPLCAWVGLLPARFLFTILCCKHLSVKL